MNALIRLQNLFRELFQLDVADLDFGIYRLLHLKRDEVEAFLTRDLPATVDKEFKAAAGADIRKCEAGQGLCRQAETTGGHRGQRGAEGGGVQSPVRVLPPLL